MNGRCVDRGHRLVPLPQPHVLAGLIGDQGFERKATVKIDANHRPFPIQVPNVPEQTVASAALRRVGSRFLQRHVLGVDADIDFLIQSTFAAGWRRSDNLLWADLNGCKAVSQLHDLATPDGIDAYNAGPNAADSFCEDLLY